MRRWVARYSAHVFISMTLLQRLYNIKTILVVYVILGVMYSVANPIFESPDEFLHYQFVRYVIDRRELPVMSPGELSEYHQPPVYYLLGALIIGGVPVEPYAPEPNPFWGYEINRFGVDNKVRFVPTPADTFPYQRTALAVHLLRLLSLALGAVSVAVGYRALRETFVERPALALGATAVFAFHPQFVFISSSINNDNLAIPAGMLILLWSVRVAREGVTVRRAALGGLLLAWAVLSKISAGVLAAVPVVAALMASGSKADRFRACLVIAAITALVSGWWFIRNLQLYGELTEINSMLETWGRRSIAEGVFHLEGQLRYIWTSFWGRFGIGQIVLPDLVYTLLALVSLAAWVGLIRKLLERRAEARGLIVLGALALSMFAGLIVFALINPSGAMGRYLFPSLAALAGLLVFGLRGLYRPVDAALDRRFAAGLFASMLVFNLGALFGVLVPAYAMPETLSVDQARRATQPADIRFGDAAVLLGYALDRDRVAPGEELRVKLCWRVLRSLRSNAYLFIHLLGPENIIVGRRETYPGLGRYPTVNWRAGHIFCDDVPLRVETWAAAPAVYAVEVGLVDVATRARLSAIGPDGVGLSPAIVTRMKVRPARPAASDVVDRVGAHFGDEIALLQAEIAPDEVRPGESVQLELHWRALSAPTNDYTVFVHVLDAAGALVAQADSQPQSDRYPTRFWDVGEFVRDVHPITFPRTIKPGRYVIQVGLYVLQTGERLLLQNASASAVNVGAIEVRR